MTRFAIKRAAVGMISWLAMLIAVSPAMGQQEQPSVEEKSEAQPPQKPEPPKLNEPEPDEPKPEEIVQAVYKMTATAKTWEEYDELVKMCEKHRGKLPPAQDRYLKRLMAWSQNRRGQEYAKKALQAMETGNADEAQEIEKQALADFNAAIANDPTRWKPFHNRGVSMAMEGKFKQALEDFDTALKLNQRYPNTWFNRGEVRYQLGRLEDAVSDYTRALSLKEDAATYTSRAHTVYELADKQQGARQRRELFERALNDFDRAIALDSQNAENYANRADALQSYREWERALLDYVQAVKIDNKLARAYQGAGWLMATSPEPRFRRQLYQLRAMQYAQAAIRLKGEEDENYYLYLDTLAAAQANAGKFDEAVETLTKALAVAPEKARDLLEKRQAIYKQQQPYRQ